MNLAACDPVQLGAAIPLPRLAGVNNNVPIVYPGILNIKSGAGGVILGAPGSPASLTLFPSTLGSLTIDTTGSLVNALNSVRGAPQLFNLIVSDSGFRQYAPSAIQGGIFGPNDHAASPVHLNNPTPIDLTIGGNMNLINPRFSRSGANHRGRQHDQLRLSKA